MLFLRENMMNSTVDYIHVQWSGPHKLEGLSTLCNENTDYGVYQIYGAHPIYGLDVLLYIGKADKQTFAQRVPQSEWEVYNQDPKGLSVYVGRLSGYDGTPPNAIWSERIALVERLLIFAHCPAANSAGLNVEFGNETYGVHILNWGEYRSLLPEVSGARYSTRFDSDDGYLPYGAQSQAEKS